MDTPAQQSFAPPSGAPVELHSAEPAQLPRLQLEAPQPTIDTSTAPLPAIVPAPDDEAPPHTERPSTGSVWRRRIPLIVGFLLIVAAVVLAVQAFREFGAANDTTPVEDSIRPASPILEPIDDAQDVVDDINGTATEALDELGLDPTGRPQPLGYRFTTIDALGTSLTVTVDTTTGNFAIDGDNGSAFRSISDNVVTRLVATDPWSPIDAGAADVIQPFGLEQALQVQDVLPGSIRSFTTVDDQDAGIFRLDYAAATNGEPEAMNAWATRFGVDFLAAELLITLQVDDAGYVEAFSVGLPDEAPAFRYLLDELYDATAPQIML